MQHRPQKFSYNSPDRTIIDIEGIKSRKFQPNPEQTPLPSHAISSR
jgi:hypothetical protein